MHKLQHTGAQKHVQVQRPQLHQARQPRYAARVAMQHSKLMLRIGWYGGVRVQTSMVDDAGSL